MVTTNQQTKQLTDLTGLTSSVKKLTFIRLLQNYSDEEKKDEDDKKEDKKDAQNKSGKKR